MADIIPVSTLSARQKRRDVFLESAKAFGPTLAAQGYLIPTTAPSPDLVELIERQDGYTRPLTVEMEALLWPGAVPARRRLAETGLAGNNLGFVL